TMPIELNGSSRIREMKSPQAARGIGPDDSAVYGSEGLEHLSGGRARLENDHDGGNVGRRKRRGPSAEHRAGRKQQGGDRAARISRIRSAESWRAAPEHPPQCEEEHSEGEEPQQIPKQGRVGIHADAMDSQYPMREHTVQRVPDAETDQSVRYQQAIRARARELRAGPPEHCEPD